MKTKKYQLGQQSKNRSRKRLYLLVAILLLIGLGSILFVRSRANDRTSSVPSSDTPAPVESPSKSKSTEHIAGIDTGTTSEEVPLNSSLSSTIDGLTQKDGLVSMAASIVGASTSGACVFTFTTVDSKPVTKQVSSTAQGNTQVCTANISEVEFDKVGEWKLEFTFYLGNSKTQASKQVTIR